MKPEKIIKTRAEEKKISNFTEKVLLDQVQVTTSMPSEQTTFVGSIFSRVLGEGSQAACQVKEVEALQREIDEVDELIRSETLQAKIAERIATLEQAKERDQNQLAYLRAIRSRYNIQR